MDITSAEDVDNYVQTITTNIREAYYEACPLTTLKPHPGGLQSLQLCVKI